MPCSDGGPSEYEEHMETQERLDRVTRMLCGLIKLVEKRGFAGFVKDADSELPRWWEDHQEKDRKRIAAERREEARNQKKKNALKKLTKEEKRLLFLKDE